MARSRFGLTWTSRSTGPSSAVCHRPVYALATVPRNQTLRRRPLKPKMVLHTHGVADTVGSISLHGSDDELSS
jgi:hypothetical protein